MESSRSVFAANVRGELARRDLRHADLAPVLGLTQGAVSMKLSGQRPITTEEAEAIASFLNIDPGELFRPIDSTPPRAQASL